VFRGDESWMHVPAHLPVAPRPIADEWRPADEVWMTQGALVFDPDQARRMRMALMRFGREV
jgi:hypothetical protein